MDICFVRIYKLCMCYTLYILVLFLARMDYYREASFIFYNGL